MVVCTKEESVVHTRLHITWDFDCIYCLMSQVNNVMNILFPNLARLPNVLALLVFVCVDDSHSSVDKM